MVQFVEDPNLNRLAVILRHFDAGDRVLRGCLELFSCEPKSNEKIVSDNIGKIIRRRKSTASCEIPDSTQPSLTETNPSTKSPLLDEQKTSREIVTILNTLMSTLNQCYPDFDFCEMAPENFNREHSFVEVYDNINYHLASVVERLQPGLLHDLWSAIKAAVQLDTVEIYSSGDPFSQEGGSFFFSYFFMDKYRQRTLFFSCRTTSKCLHLDFDDMTSEDEEYSDESMLDDSSSDEFEGEAPSPSLSMTMSSFVEPVDDEV